MLLKTQTPEFPILLLQEMKEIPLIVNVGGAGGGSLGLCKRLIVVPSNYPPVTAYSFAGRPSQEATMTFEGPITIYAIPQVYSPGNQYEYCTDESLDLYVAYGTDPNRHRVRYLSSFLKLPEDGITFSKYFTINWEGPEPYKKALTSYCNKILDKYDRMVGLLLERGVIAKSQEESLKCTISMEIYDTRFDRTVPLPEFSLDRVIIGKSTKRNGLR
jgi:hypothetical protein